MTTITLTPDLEEAVARQAQRQATTPESLVLDTLREKFGANGHFQMRTEGTSEAQDEWERRLRAAAVHAGVWLTDEQTSREVIYEDHD